MITDNKWFATIQQDEGLLLTASTALTMEAHTVAICMLVAKDYVHLHVWHLENTGCRRPGIAKDIFLTESAHLKATLLAYGRKEWSNPRRTYSVTHPSGYSSLIASSWTG